MTLHDQLLAQAAIHQAVYDISPTAKPSQTDLRSAHLLRQAATTLSSIQARAEKLEAELAEAKRERDDALSERDACHTVMRDFRETIQPVIPNARRMFFFSIAEEILAQHQSAESSLTQARVALKLLVKYARWQIEEGPGHHPTLPSAIAVAQTALAGEGE